MCCGTMKPKDSRYNSYDLKKKYCWTKGKDHFDLDDYDYTFTCDTKPKGTGRDDFVKIWDDYNEQITYWLWVAWGSYAIFWFAGYPLTLLMSYIFQFFNWF